MNLDDFFNINYTWTDLILITFVLAIGYLLLFFLRRILVSLNLKERLKNILRVILDRTLILYEPIFVLIVVTILVMIKPAFHGLIIGLIAVFSYNHLRNYVHGRFIMSDRSLKNGRRIKIGNQEGIITDIGRLGLSLRSDEGLHYLPYHILYSKGFVLSSGEKIGGYYHLFVRPNQSSESALSIEHLKDIIIASPYIDTDHTPEIAQSISSDGGINVKLLVKEEDHIQDLIDMLTEQGFTSTISKS